MPADLKKKLPRQLLLTRRLLLTRLPLLLRIATHVGGLAPALVLWVDYLTHNLTANPIQAAEQRTGVIALVFLLLSLACTPLNTLFRFSLALRQRKALGLYAFFYSTLHLVIFAGADYGFDWPTLWQMVIQNRYLLVGTLAFIILIALAVTSFRRAMKGMGMGWKRLHQLVYPAAVLVILHFAWSLKGDLFRLNGDVRRPLAYGAVLAALLVMRLPPVRRAISGLRERLKRVKSDRIGIAQKGRGERERKPNPGD